MVKEREKYMIVNILLLLVGFVLLIKGADFFVDGASSISKKCNIPPVIIGLTVVAMGTSCPEAAVSIQAAINKSNAIAISNVSGSNLFNILVVIGAINWGLIGFFGFDLVRVLFGDMSLLSRIVYALVGVSGLYALSYFGRLKNEM